jgi:hypothetical protein
VPLGLLLAEALREAVTQVLKVALPHCETEGVKLTECVAHPLCEGEGVKLTDAHEEPLWLAITEEENEGVTVGECAPLVLPLTETLQDDVAQALSVALPHCEIDCVWLAECVALPHCEREGVPLADTQEEPLKLADTEKLADGDNVEECAPLVLPLAETLWVAEGQALCVVLPHCERDGVKLAETLNVGVKLAVCVALPHFEMEGV